MSIKLLTRFVMITTLVVGLFSLTFSQVRAEECDRDCDTNDPAYVTCLEGRQQCLVDLVKQTQQKANTLGNAISILNGQIKIQQLQISQTVAEIEKLSRQIEDLSTRISGIELSLDKMSSILIERVNANYKHKTPDPIILLLNADSFSQFLTDYKYLQIAQSHISEVMKRAEEQRIAYDQQKTLKEEKQAEIEAKRNQLKKQEQELNNQKTQQTQLLTVTKNDEKKYQQLLAEARAEIASFKTFATNKGGGTVSAQSSPDGWYFSQRDERWAGVTIGSSGEKMLEVGCLISSTAMIKKKFGEDVTPVTIATNGNYFFSNTAYMLKPWPAPSGYYYSDVSYSQSTLDQELERNPVIVKLLAGPYGTHFLVIKEKKDGKYIMHDPWEGYDKNFSDYYSLSQISRISRLVKN